jgi:hypothetical protein
MCRERILVGAAEKEEVEERSLLCFLPLWYLSVTSVLIHARFCIVSYGAVKTLNPIFPLP